MRLLTHGRRAGAMFDEMNIFDYSMKGASLCLPAFATCTAYSVEARGNCSYFLRVYWRDSSPFYAFVQSAVDHIEYDELGSFLNSWEPIYTACATALETWMPEVVRVLETSSET